MRWRASARSIWQAGSTIISRSRSPLRPSSASPAPRGGEGGNPPLAPPPAKGGGGVREDYLAGGFDDYLSKPSPPEPPLGLARRWAGAGKPNKAVADSSFDSFMEDLRHDFRA